MGKQYRHLFKRYSEGKSSEKEARAVNTYFSKIQEYGIKESNIDTDAVGQLILFRIEKKLGQKKMTNFYRMIASVAAIILLGTLWFTFNSVFNTNHYITVAAKFGEQKKMMLPDSSIVYLNSGSSIIYPEHFGENSRAVSLKGEAYFEVMHKEKHPFIISSNHFKTQVLGTRFIVTNYEKGIPSVTVVSGKVQVTDLHSSNSEIITKNQRVIYDDKTGSLVRYNTIESSDYLAWKDGRVFFDHANIDQVLLTLQRKYNVVLKLDSPLYQCNTISGNFSGNNIEKILNAIRFINDMDFVITKKDTINIRLKPCKN
ncbi:FecR family protein [Flavobacterium sp. HJJ]|uniref:FecR family protein n=1 Tax=Flavobacterium sp. HJJ TaxID=2783792 RepID=UPI00188BF07F|nr:FecR domain-containing protein [Flavobacterium sp. HJJ]MBF4472915.1 FecR domain-containing protein [Flavobacterium sp. HJJ]